MKKLLLIFISLTVVGCASTQNKPVNPATLATLDGKTLTLVKRESPVFVAMTSGKGMFAMAGVGAAAVAGNKLVKENGIIDPAQGIGEALATQLHQKHGLHFAGVSAAAAPSDKVSAISQAAGNSKYALDVATNGWSYMYDGFKFSEYYVGYSAKLRLIDVINGKVLSSGMCIYNPKEAGQQAVSHDTLVANNAAFIKQQMSAAASHCTEQFASKLFAGS